MMVRKQVYITREQNEALKRKAGELGITEAELIRRGIEQLAVSQEQESQYRVGRGSSAGRVREVAEMEYGTRRATSGAQSDEFGVFSRGLEEDAWQAEMAFMRSLDGTHRGEQRREAWRFNREEVYEERLSQILRRH